MGVEQKVEGLQDWGLKDLEGRLSVKEIKLPKGVRAHIRRLKESGEWEKAMGVRKQEVEKKLKSKQERAWDELNKTVRSIIVVDDDEVQAQLELKALWLFNVLGEMSSQDRIKSIIELLDSKSPALKEAMEEKMVSIRDSMKKFM